MNKKGLIESLLWQEEGTSLDFKREQYRFSGEVEGVKSELLKDILAFANAWRQTNAHILIGVKEVQGRKSEIIGIESHIDDAILQEFVNKKTNKPIVFSYEAITIDDSKVALITIPVQPRPFYVKKNYGRVIADKIYLRRGSSTDIASLDEVMEMGKSVTKQEINSPILTEFFIIGEEAVAPTGRLLLGHPELTLVNLTLI